jgi:hypothetical protein
MNQTPDIVDQALAAINAQPDLDGPSELVIASTLASLRRVPIYKPTRAMQFLRVAAIVAVSVTVITALWRFPRFSSVSYGDVAEHLRAAHTMTWVQTVAGSQPADQMPTKMYFSATGQTRIEDPDGIISIFDRFSHTTLILDNNLKTATLMRIHTTGGPPQSSPDQSFAFDFRKLADQPGTPIADRQIGNVLAKGFSVQIGDHPVSLWVDPRSHLPIRMEMSASFAGREVESVFSDIVFDAPIDPSLFSLDVPPGYTVKRTETSLNINLDLESNLLNILRPYTALSHGVFPPRLNDTAAFNEIAFGSDAESQKVSMSATALSSLMFSMQKGRDYDYRPADVKLGEAGKIVFWYRKRDNGAYRAIYGDLHAADVTAEQLH